MAISKITNDGIGDIDELTVDTDTLVVDSTNNRVGIGTSSPSKSLHVYHPTTNKPALIESGDAFSLLEFKDGSTTNIPAIGADGNNIIIQTGSLGTERMRIDSSGNVGIGTSLTASSSAVKTVFSNTSGGTYIQTNSGSNGGLVLGTDGGGAGVFFTYTGAVGSESYSERMRILPSGGITFNGDTAAANALDDYEEGTFNPFSGIGSVFTGESIPNARYRKIGKLVHVDCRVAWTATDNSSNPFALTLPFNSAVVSGSYAGAAAHTGAVFYSGTAVQSGNAVSAHMSGGSNSVGFYSTAGGNFSSVRRNEVNGTYDWLFSITYPTDS